MNIRDIFVSAAVRKIAYLLIAALIGLASAWWNTASAQSAYPQCNDDNYQYGVCATDYEAKAAAQLWWRGWLNSHYGAQATYNNIHKSVPPNEPPNSWCSSWNSPASGNYGGICAKSWAAIDQCAGAPPDPFNPGQCMTQEKCLARNQPDNPLFPGTGSQSWVGSARGCAGGCEIGIAGWPSPVLSTVRLPGGGTVVSNVYSGRKAYTGKVMDCSKSTQDDGTATPPVSTPEMVQTEKKEEECMAVAGTTMCIEKDGHHCGTASNGRRHCWGVGETGEKTDKNVASVTKAGSAEGDAALKFPSGEIGAKRETVVVEKTVNNKTITTATTTYVGSSGANAGSTNQGEPANPATGGAPAPGSGTGEGGDESSDDETGSGKGGASCGAAPVCQGGDEQICLVAYQSWLIRCDTDGVDTKDTVGAEADGEGDAQVNDLMRDPTDAERGGTFDENGDPLADHKEVTTDNWFQQQFNTAPFLGAPACPAGQIVPVRNGSLGISFQVLCDMFAKMSGLVMALAYVVGFKLIVRGG